MSRGAPSNPVRIVGPLVATPDTTKVTAVSSRTQALSQALKLPSAITNIASQSIAQNERMEQIAHQIGVSGEQLKQAGLKIFREEQRAKAVSNRLATDQAKRDYTEAAAIERTGFMHIVSSLPVEDARRALDRYPIFDPKNREAVQRRLGGRIAANLLVKVQQEILEEQNKGTKPSDIKVTEVIGRVLGTQGALPPFATAEVHERLSHQAATMVRGEFLNAARRRQDEENQNTLFAVEGWVDMFLTGGISGMPAGFHGPTMPSEKIWERIEEEFEISNFFGSEKGRHTKGPLIGAAINKQIEDRLNGAVNPGVVQSQLNEMRRSAPDYLKKYLNDPSLKAKIEGEKAKWALRAESKVVKSFRQLADRHLRDAAIDSVWNASATRLMASDISPQGKADVLAYFDDQKARMTDTQNGAARMTESVLGRRPYEPHSESVQQATWEEFLGESEGNVAQALEQWLPSRYPIRPQVLEQIESLFTAGPSFNMDEGLAFLEMIDEHRQGHVELLLMKGGVFKDQDTRRLAQTSWDLHEIVPTELSKMKLVMSNPQTRVAALNAGRSTFLENVDNKGTLSDADERLRKELANKYDIKLTDISDSNPELLRLYSLAQWYMIDNTLNEQSDKNDVNAADRAFRAYDDRYASFRGHPMERAWLSEVEVLRPDDLLDRIESEQDQYTDGLRDSINVKSERPFRSEDNRTVFPVRNINANPDFPIAGFQVFDPNRAREDILLGSPVDPENLSEFGVGGFMGTGMHSFHRRMKGLKEGTTAPRTREEVRVFLDAEFDRNRDKSMTSWVGPGTEEYDRLLDRLLAGQPDAARNPADEFTRPPNGPTVFSEWATPQRAVSLARLAKDQLQSQRRGAKVVTAWPEGVKYGDNPMLDMMILQNLAEMEDIAEGILQQKGWESMD